MVKRSAGWDQCVGAYSPYLLPNQRAMVYIVMAYIVVAYIVMAYIVMAYIAVAWQRAHGRNAVGV